MRGKGRELRTIDGKRAPGLRDHLPHVLAGIIEALRDPRVDTGPLESSPGPEGAAAIHGAQRLRLGFSLDAVVREYGVLREAITRTALESGATIQLSEHEIVANAIVAGSRRRSRSCGGLSPEEVQAMFAPFVRLTQKKAHGFGLGLAIAKAAAEARGGTIRVENLPGRGCRFVLKLPNGAGARS
jgi:hypothetical protein